MDRAFPKEAVKEFVLQRLRLTPDALGKCMEDVPKIVRAIGGLQYGGHKLELLSRFQAFKSEWFDYWYENHKLTEGHVLRSALRIVDSDEYVYYFMATRNVARRRKYHNCPNSLKPEHLLALSFLSKNGPFTPSEFRRSFGAEHAQYGSKAVRLLYDLYNYGKAARMGRKRQKPLFQAIEKLPYNLDVSRVSEEEAQEWLFLKSLDIYGPFRPRDVAHWVGWNLRETGQILDALVEADKVVCVSVEGSQEPHYVKTEDLQVLESISHNLPTHSFIRILFNDDALLLGYYLRLRDYFGYDWVYPQFSNGVVWRAAVLYGRELIGDAVVDMYEDSKLFDVRRLVLRREYARSEIVSKIKEEFARQALFQGKTLRMTHASTK